MKKTFRITYEGHQIEVENRWFNGEKLYVDGELQDENLGLALRATLAGVLTTNNGERKRIKVAIGGFFKIHCKIFIDNKLIFPEER
ncbi:hypothetical protein RYX56_00195 [Alkalihalophilus lindianensis]|uniref:Uncharacterized protein n=1 Tax=Alkalihalophilus lindianensis TaxID=1630542 RepID=A0ABU3X5Q5_9BACI|nr:hypothetical protein [Alkalihalophilus lindianensis]MDV2682784.1 hypothetical protein [Alkalihalophilus lindianensis]